MPEYYRTDLLNEIDNVNTLDGLKAVVMKVVSQIEAGDIDRFYLQDIIGTVKRAGPAIKRGKTQDEAFVREVDNVIQKVLAYEVSS